MRKFLEVYFYGLICALIICVFLSFLLGPLILLDVGIISNGITIVYYCLLIPFICGLLILD